MTTPILLDCHCHTSHSPDSNSPASSMCEKAARIGLGVFAITDHCECDLYQKDNYKESVRTSLNEARALKEQYAASPLKIMAGVELGQPLQNPEAARDVLALPFDQVIGSLHNLSGVQDFYFIQYSSYSDQELNQLMKEYLEQLYEMAVWGGFDTLAHLTYPLRYIAGDHGRNITLKNHMDAVSCVLKELVHNDKALEINTSGLRQKIGQTLPDAEIVRLYHDLGGKYLTVGSDAHKPEDVGAGISEGLHIAAQAGFREICYFENRKPVLIPIP